MTETQIIPMDLENQTFIRGIELANKRFVLMTQDPNLDIETAPHTGFCYWEKDPGWCAIGLGGTLTLDATTNEDASAVLHIDPEGFLHEIGGGPTKKETLRDRDGNPPSSPINGIRCVGDHVFAVGVERQAYARHNFGKWNMISPPEIMDPAQPASFQAIDGLSPRELYAVGWDGEIWSFDGENWQQRESPTNVVLNDICGGDDQCVAVGLAGTVLLGRGDAWDVIRHDETNEPFWAVRYFDGAFYMTAVSGIYCLKDGQLSMFRETDKDMRTTYGLSVGPSGLWSIGTSDVVLFDGTDWRTIGQS